MKYFGGGNLCNHVLQMHHCWWCTLILQKPLAEEDSLHNPSLIACIAFRQAFPLVALCNHWIYINRVHPKPLLDEVSLC